MAIETRPLTETSVSTCDWGHCDDTTVAERYDPASGQWLAVCERHGGQRPAARPSPGPGRCARCPAERALTVAGKMRAHDNGFAQRCPGSGRDPAPREDTP